MTPEEKAKLAEFVAALTNEERGVLREYISVIDAHEKKHEREATYKEHVTCLECKHRIWSDHYAGCSKGYKGIVRPDDSCGYGERIDV